MLNMLDVAYYTIGGLGTILNAIVLITLGTSKSQTHKDSRLYFLHQAGIDLCSSVLLILGTLDIDQNVFTQPGGNFVCMVWSSRAIMWSFLVSGTYNLVVTSLDR